MLIVGNVEDFLFFTAIIFNENSIGCIQIWDRPCFWWDRIMEWLWQNLKWVKKQHFGSNNIMLSIIKDNQICLYHIPKRQKKKKKNIMGD